MKIGKWEEKSLLDKENSNINEEIINVENNEEITVEEILVENIVKKESKNMTIIKKLLVGVIDQIIIFAASLLTLIVFDFLLKLIGLFVAEREPVFLIIYALLNVIYIPICEGTRLRKTIGKKILFK